MVLDAAPHPLDENGLLAAFSDPFPDLATEPPFAKGALELDDNGFILTSKLHDGFSPAFAVEIGHDETKDHFSCISPFGCESDS